MTIGDGTPKALINELLEPLRDVPLPIGTIAYNALCVPKHCLRLDAATFPDSPWRLHHSP